MGSLSAFSLILTNSRLEIARWFAERGRPFNLVRDGGFQILSLSGRKDHWLPSPRMVSRDVKIAFGATRMKVAELLQV